MRWGFIFPGVSLHPAVSHSPVLCGGRRSSFPPNAFNHLSSNCLIAVNVNSTFSASERLVLCACACVRPRALPRASQGPSGSVSLQGPRDEHLWAQWLLTSQRCPSAEGFSPVCPALDTITSGSVVQWQFIYIAQLISTSVDQCAFQ